MRKPHRSARSHPKHHGPVKKAHKAPSGPVEYAEGVLQLKGKFGFVLSEDPKVGDVLVQGQSLRMALADDRVKAKVTSEPNALRRSGVIVEVVKRARDTVVGTFKRLGNMEALVLEGSDVVVQIIDMQKFTPAVQDVVVVRVTKWPTESSQAAGVLIEVLGSRDTPGVDLEAVIRQHNLSTDFPEQAENEARVLGTEVKESAWKGTSRESFIGQRVFTIDGADAKDFDDAVSVQIKNDGWQLGVHIADVSHYVTSGSALDEEARERGTSVYLSGRVIPMLPFPISDGLCSLRPDSVRLTLSCIMDINKNGDVTNRRVVESVINSVKRFTYDDVEEIINGGAASDIDPKIKADVLEMDKLAKVIRENRFGRGSLDFDFPEPDIVTGLNGRPIDIKRRDRLEAHRLIEDFMVLANETVAEYMAERPFLYRIHEIPDPARMEKLQKSLKILGVNLPPNTENFKPMTLRRVLLQSVGTPNQPIIQLMVLRSLKQAIYSPNNRGHFGLASKCYTHFTSPIRRYPDLIVHRLLKERIHNIDHQAMWQKELPSICAHTSKRERIAVEAEREFMDIQKTRLMEPHVGKEFTGVVSGVTNFGFFVQLDQYFVEGLVHVTSLLKDYYFFDEARMTLTGRKTGKTFSLGNKVKIRLVKTNILTHQIDFMLLDGGEAKKPAPSKFNKSWSKRRKR